MKVLVACEFSGIVRDAFIKQGHFACSCDLLPTERLGPHITGDALEAIHSQSWDLLIAHPPCTYLAHSGVRWLYEGGVKTNNNIDEQRWENMRKGAAFFKALLDAPVPRIACENPVMHGYALELIGTNRTQLIQPWQFGHGEKKATCLWLKNLPPLVPTNIVEGRRPRSHFVSPSPDRWKKRSVTLTGIADAMAAQWGSHLMV